MNLTIHTIDTAPDRSRPVLTGMAGDLGVLPNMAAAMATSPVLITALNSLRKALESGQLDPVLREAAGVAVGVAVDNAYGVAFHSTMLARYGVDQPEIDRMRAGRLPSDPRTAAVYELARQIALTRGKVDGATIERATAAGLSTADVLEIVTECTLAGLVGVVDNLAGRVELDEFLAPQAWHQ